jgi:hypothetical protein
MPHFIPDLPRGFTISRSHLLGGDASSLRRGLLARLPRLEAIFSLGAGVDPLLADRDLPDVPVVRIVDPDLNMRLPAIDYLLQILRDPRLRQGVVLRWRSSSRHISSTE